MPVVENLILRFSGNKAELKKQLQDWCELNGTNMNKKVIELIQELIEAEKLKEINQK